MLQNSFCKKQDLVLNQGKINKQSYNPKHILIKRNQMIQKGKPISRKRLLSMHVAGRCLINLYRICQFQLKLTSFTFQNVIKQLFKIKAFSKRDCDLSQLFLNEQGKWLEYMTQRIVGTNAIICKLNYIDQVVQFTKLFGCDFQSMMERGSQFKIQSILSRVACNSNYLLLSASKIQVAGQKVMECRSLVIQPQKQFYAHPVIVLDFQSLYPSIMIAFNYCYSTCLGSVKELVNSMGQKRLGVAKSMNISLQKLYRILQEQSPQRQRQLQNYAFISPSKTIFLRKQIRQGLIPNILKQFLVTRVMIKQSSKLYKHKPELQKILNSRQLAIKLFMNVMYGYTGASFTGRMPCSQLADAVVQTGKYLLRNAIGEIKEGDVIYGDTDSIFIHLKDKSLKQAFEIGKSLQRRLSQLYPQPIQLKFQKVYSGLFLTSKKRYYGLKYQKLDQQPEFEGKGLECVRRDGCPLMVNIMKQSLNQVINTKNLSKLKRLLKYHILRIVSFKENLLDFCLAKEVKLAKYSSIIPAHARAAQKLAQAQPMMIPKYGERVKYFIISKGQKSVLRERTVPALLLRSFESLDVKHYLYKLIIPALQRVLCAVDFDIQKMVGTISETGYLPLCKFCMACRKSLCQKCKKGDLYKFMQDWIQQKKKVIQNCVECSGDLSFCMNFDCRVRGQKLKYVESDESLFMQSIEW